MSLELTALIVSQVKTLVVMFCGGIFTESLWQVRRIFLHMFVTGGKRPVEKREKAGSVKRKSREGMRRSAEILSEIFFWCLAAACVSMFLYYSSFGKLSVHAVVGFLSGLLLWKKICCDIIKSWVKTDEAKSTETTARSSTWKRREPRGWKKDVLKKRKKRKSF